MEKRKACVEAINVLCLNRVQLALTCVTSVPVLGSSMAGPHGVESHVRIASQYRAT